MYLYIINEHMEVKICKEPSSSYNSIFNKNRFIDIVHPVIAQDDNYSVLFSGEVFVIKTDRKVNAVLVNNKSGHYLPSNDYKDIMYESFSKAFELDKERIFYINVCHERLFNINNKGGYVQNYKVC